MSEKNPSSESQATQEHQHTNRLSKEKSPYLLQHQHNPVDWYPWGEEAFTKAKTENKPIFLSIGYSTCHWCHVMERESFESDEVAAILNVFFVSIKVDREERPDVDKIYMTYVQATSGGGGWPLSLFLTPDLHPIFGATYFPPEDKYGRPGFKSILKKINHLWTHNKEDVSGEAKRLMDALQEHASGEEIGEKAGLKADTKLMQKSYAMTAQTYDAEYGGFSEMPKFPRPVTLNHLFDVYGSNFLSESDRKKALSMTLHTLRKMAAGGMYDQVGHGFHRYSVDYHWHVPHFEKMLYDQGQLAWSYLDAFQITKEKFFEDVARGVFYYVNDKLTSPEGGFYCAEDADSLFSFDSKEKGEGAFYVWTSKELRQVIGDEKDADIYQYAYDVRERGNTKPESDPHEEFKGKNVLKEEHSAEVTAKKFGITAQEVVASLERSRKKLYAVREKRPKPHLDDKIVVAWNGLMISAYARGYQVLKDKSYLEAAKKAANFIKHTLRQADDFLIRNYRHTPSAVRGFADDYAFLIKALIDLYEASFEIQWLQWARELQEVMDRVFWDSKSGGYFGDSGLDKSILIRMKEEYDGAEPSPNSVAALNLIKLSQYFSDEGMRKKAEQVITTFPLLFKAPVALPQMMVAVSWLLEKPHQIVLAGAPTDPNMSNLVDVVNDIFIPHKILILADGGEGQKYLATGNSFMESVKPVNNQPTAYVCQNFTCQLPTNDPNKLRELLGGTSHSS